MGKDDATAVGGFIGEVTDKINESGSAGSTSTTDSRTDNGTGNRTGTGTGRTEAEKEVVSSMAVLTEAQERERKRQERNAKRRERYAQEKAENGQSVKPRKVNGTKKNAQPTVDTTQVAMIITTMSTIIASRPNMAHWQLTPTEVQQLATPIGNMIAKSEALSQFGEHADAIALVTAVIAIAVPRVFITLQLQKPKEKKNNVTGVKNPVGTGRKQDTSETRKDSITDKQSNDASAVNGSPDGVTVGYIGEPI